MDPSLHARPHPRRRLRCALLALACGTGAAHAATPPPYLQTQRSSNNAPPTWCRV